MFELFLHYHELPDSVIYAALVLVLILIALFPVVVASRQILFTKAVQEAILLIMRGNDLNRLVSIVSGWTHKKHNNDIFEMVEGPPHNRNFYMKFLGLHYIGVLTNVHYYDSTSFMWCLLNKDGKSELSIVAVKERLGHLKIQNTHPIKTYIHTKHGIPIEVKLQITTWTKFPGLTIFRTKASEWQMRVITHAIEIIRDFVGNLSIEDLTRGQHSISASQLKKAFEERNNDLLTLTGQKIIEVKYLGYSQITDQAILQSIMQGYTSQQEAIGIVNLGEATAKAKELYNKAVKESDQNFGIETLQAVKDARGLILTDGKGNGILPVLPFNQRIITP